MKYKDQLRRTISLALPPKRIVSLVPSQTELLVDLGLVDSLVGVTKFCVHPKGLKKEKTIIGGTKNFHFDKIDLLKPDLIIGNKEENYKEGINQLSEKYPVWMSDIRTLEDAFQMMLGIGQVTGTHNKAEVLVQKIRSELNFVPKRKATAVYLIWDEPLMAAGKNTFINEMLFRAGFVNMMEKDRYPKLSTSELKALAPEYLLLSSEPYPFKQKQLTEFAALLPQSKILLVDGEMFSWYGSRLLFFKGYLDFFKL
ncbi:helical backbone metal receptor [Aquiflexum sp.]|uniref:helical backbone metal receptor n=1 Tax=Aquiflexum sp. TaxID=1872584 RepID=UPI003593D1CE